MNPRITRRQFTLGVAAGASAAALGPLPAHAGGQARQRPFFDQTTLWDASVDPLANYHVHGLTVLDDDTILAMTEGRYETCDAGPRDLLLRRSLDGGDTWEQTRTVAPSVDGQSWGNPTLLADRHSGEVFLFYALSVRLPENTSCSGDSADLFVISSRDRGVTWSAPRNLSELFAGFAYDWALHSPGPGHGLQLDNGRLLLNVAHRRVIVGNTVTQRFYGVAGIYSDDHGRTWQPCGEVPVSVDYPINEARIVQRDDGTVLINGRNGAGGTGSRIVAVSADRGRTWSAPRMDGATGVFNSVDASLVRYSGGPGSRERNRMLFSRPDSPTRFNMTVSVSYDEGYSLRYSRVINPGRAFYSDLARLSDGTILLFYGCDGDLAGAPLRVNLARFDLAWLTEGRDAIHLSESVYKLARNAHGQTVVTEATSRAGARLILGAGTVDLPFTVARSGSYELGLRYYRPADGGLTRVTIDGAALHNYLIDTTAEKSEGYDYVTLGTKWLREGRHHVRFEHAGPGRGGGSTISVDTLSLIRCAAPRDNPDEITIDNAGLGYTVVAGTWAAGTGVPGYYGSNYSSHAAGTGANVVRWQPAIPADADYEVRVSYTPASNRATNAPFTVTHAGGSTVVPVNQQVAGVPDPRSGTWVSLGVFPFAAGLAGTIALSDQADGVVVADAVRLLRR